MMKNPQKKRKKSKKGEILIHLYIQFEQLVTQHIIEKLSKNQDWIKWLKESLKHFTIIKKNIYIDRKKKQPNLNELYDCNCRRSLNPEQTPANEYSYNCDDRCINKLMCIECFEDICPCLELCNNRRFQKHQDKCVYPFPSEGKGWGLCAGEQIPRGSFITQYIGEVFNINSEEGRARCAEYSSSTCTYMMRTSGNDVIDPTYKGNLARFMNHSCDPNCETQKWHVLGETCIGLFAIKDIEEGSELTFDYGFDAFKTPLTKCLCGAANCKGYLGQKPTDMTVEEWVKELDNLPCMICGGNTEDDDELLMLCDLCNKGFHTFCLGLVKVPDDAWFCDKCIQVMKNRDAQEQEKKFMQGLKHKKEKAIRQKIKLIEQSESDDDKKYSDEYEMVYNFQKKLECEAIEELYDMKNQDDVEDLQKIKIKKKKLDEKLRNQDSIDLQYSINTYKHKTEDLNYNYSQLNESPTRRKQQVTDFSRKVEQKFQEYLQRNPFIFDRINLYQEKNVLSKTQNQKIKQRVLLNKLEIHLLRINIMLYAKLGCQIYWDLSTSTHDQFLRCKEITVTGDEEQLEIFFQFLQNIMDSIQQIKLELGIIEANLNIPAIFLKRVIGQNHLNINRLEQQYQVSIVYNKRYVTDECYPLSQKVALLIKGKKEHIIQASIDVQEQLKKLEVQRIFLTYNETRLVLQHLAYLKRKNHKSEFRLHRDHPFKDINHSFYYIPVKEKELTLIGTREENKITEDEIFEIINKEKNKQWEEEYQQQHVLLPLYLKNVLHHIKTEIEKNSQVKIHIFDPIHPRKNITFTFTGTLELNKMAKKQLVQMLDDYLKENRKILNFSKFNLDIFQDQMLYQMTKYLFKYMQNSFLTQNTAFMKNWDIISPYMSCMDHESADSNWFFNSVRYGLGKDIDTQLYVCYVTKNLQFLKKFTYNKENYKEDIIKLLQRVTSRLISGNQQLLQKYETIFEADQMIQTQFYQNVQSKLGYSLSNINDIQKNSTRSQSNEKIQIEENPLGNYEKKLKNSLENFYQQPELKKENSKTIQKIQSSKNNSQKSYQQVQENQKKSSSPSPNQKYKNHNSSDTSKLRGNQSQSNSYYQNYNQNQYSKNQENKHHSKKYRSRTRSKSRSKSNDRRRKKNKVSKRSESSQRQKMKDMKSAYEKQLLRRNKNLKHLMENTKHRKSRQQSTSSTSSSSSSSSSASSDENKSSSSVSSSKRKQSRKRDIHHSKKESSHSYLDQKSGNYSSKYNKQSSYNDNHQYMDDKKKSNNFSNSTYQSSYTEQNNNQTYRKNNYLYQNRNQFNQYN